MAWNHVTKPTQTEKGRMSSWVSLSVCLSLVCAEREEREGKTIKFNQEDH